MENMERQKLSALIEEILRADSEALNNISNAVEERYRRLFPDQEVVYLTLPRNNLEEREKQLELAVEFLRKYHAPLL